MSAELIFGNGHVGIETGIRNDNFSVVGSAHSINSVAKGRIANGFLESNRGESETNRWLALSRIAAALNISDEWGNLRPETKLILPISRNIFQTMSEAAKDEIVKAYRADKQYLALTETKEGREDLDAFIRRRADAARWKW